MEKPERRDDAGHGVALPAADAEAWLRGLDLARPDITRAPKRPGYLRGWDILRPEHKMPILRTALGLYRMEFGRLPELKPVRSPTDGFFAMKFFGFIPAPNPADKLRTHSYVPAALRDEVIVPRRPWVDDAPVLPEETGVPRGSYYLKRALGSRHQARLVWPPSDESRAELERMMEGWTKTPYGVTWGEWWYALGAQRFFLEEDLGPRIAGHPEWRIYVRRGEPCFATLIWYDNPADRTDNAQLMIDAELRPTGAHTVGRRVADRPVPAKARRWLEIAAAMGEKFDVVRVDFLDAGEDRPVISELTLCDYNARRRFAPAAFDAWAASRLFG